MASKKVMMGDFNMMYCSKCGKQLNDDDVFCSGCGQPTGVNNGQAPSQGQPISASSYMNQTSSNNSYTDQASSIPPYNQQEPAAQENSTLAIVAIVTSFLLPGVAIIIALVGHTNYKTPKYKNMCKIAIAINIIFMIATLAYISIILNSFLILWDSLMSCPPMS